MSMKDRKSEFVVQYGVSYECVWLALWYQNWPVMWLKKHSKQISGRKLILRNIWSDIWLTESNPQSLYSSDGSSKYLLCPLTYCCWKWAAIPAAV